MHARIMRGKCRRLPLQFLLSRTLLNPLLLLLRLNSCWFLPGELPVLPMSIYGAVAMAHPQSGAEGFSAADEVFIYKYDRQASGTILGSEICSYYFISTLIKYSLLCNGYYYYFAYLQPGLPGISLMSVLSDGQRLPVYVYTFGIYADSYFCSAGLAGLSFDEGTFSVFGCALLLLFSMVPHDPLTYLCPH